MIPFSFAATATAILLHKQSFYRKCIDIHRCIRSNVTTSSNYLPSEMNLPVAETAAQQVLSLPVLTEKDLITITRGY